VYTIKRTQINVQAIACINVNIPIVFSDYASVNFNGAPIQRITSALLIILWRRRWLW